MSTPCFGKWELFDSIHPDDHRRARDLCSSCPILLDCATQAEQMMRTVRKPEGTWGGRLYGMTDKAWRRFSADSRAERIHRENVAYTDDDARRAHTAYAAG
ncbi:MAG TPA: WhiB family transcriptional regulator, partial [Galbitalea sp.]